MTHTSPPSTEPVVYRLIAEPHEVRPGGQVDLRLDIENRRGHERPLVVVFKCSRGTGTFEAASDSQFTALKPSVAGDFDTQAVLIEERGTVPRILWRSDEHAPANLEITLSADVYELDTANVTHGALEKAADGNGIGPNLGGSTVRIRIIHGDPVPRPPHPPVPAQQTPMPVQLTRAMVEPTPDQALWTIIRLSTDALSYQNYTRYIERVFCDPGPGGVDRRRVDQLTPYRSLPFLDTDPYRLLKTATEVFVQLNCGVAFDPDRLNEALSSSRVQEEERLRIGRALLPGAIDSNWRTYVGENRIMPYLELVRQNLFPWREDHRSWDGDPGTLRICEEILRDKLTHPCLVELIWSYWHEEGMLVQTMNAITYRFQNREHGEGKDPLAAVEIDPLRPLNNFLWGYIQDEEHRLSVPRRSYEYDHHYGISLLGKAVPPVVGADTRSRFIEAYHNLLYLCSIFFKEDDDTTVVADGFPILNSLREVHLLLTQGAHNQYRDLPWTARIEMLMEEWMLGRPEFRELLPRRVMVDYPEVWMHSVESMKSLQAWKSADILHYRDLGITGERILLSARFGSWTEANYPEQAANWARYFRSDIQRYIFAYRAVTGVDLTDVPNATMPSILMRERATPAHSVNRPIRAAATARLQTTEATAISQPAAQPAAHELPAWRPSEV
jgi:hypothetical protein